MSVRVSLCSMLSLNRVDIVRRVTMLVLSWDGSFTASIYKFVLTPEHPVRRYAVPAAHIYTLFDTNQYKTLKHNITSTQCITKHIAYGCHFLFIFLWTRKQYHYACLLYSEPVMLSQISHGFLKTENNQYRKTCNKQQLAHSLLIVIC